MTFERAAAMEAVLKAAAAVIATADAIDAAREAVAKSIDCHNKAGETLRQAVKNAQQIH